MFSNNSKDSNSEVQGIIPNSSPQEANKITFKYSELSTSIAKKEINNAIHDLNIEKRRLKLKSDLDIINSSKFFFIVQ